jgi:hypothetical protein
MIRHHEPNKPAAPTLPTCWQREAASACLRVENSGAEAHLFPFQQLVAASLKHADGADVLSLLFASHEVILSGRNLRELFHALQDFAVKWVRLVPERYHSATTSEDGVISSIRILPAN